MVVHGGACFRVVMRARTWSCVHVALVADAELHSHTYLLAQLLLCLLLQLLQLFMVRRPL